MPAKKKTSKKVPTEDTLKEARPPGEKRLGVEASIGEKTTREKTSHRPTAEESDTAVHPIEVSAGTFPLYHTIKKPTPPYKISEDRKDKIFEVMSGIKDEHTMEAIIGLICEHARIGGDLDVDSPTGIVFPYGCRQTIPTPLETARLLGEKRRGAEGDSASSYAGSVIGKDLTSRFIIPFDDLPVELMLLLEEFFRITQYIT